MSWPICYEYADGEWMQLENPLENAFTDWPDGMEMDTYLEEKQYCAKRDWMVCLTSRCMCARGRSIMT